MCDLVWYKAAWGSLTAAMEVPANQRPDWLHENVRFVLYTKILW